MSNQTVREGYNKAAEKYLGYRDMFNNNKYLDLLIKKLSPGATILDIGCGAGVPVDKYLLERGFKLKGIDISEKQIELARVNCPEGEYEVKDMSQLQDGEFGVDAVVSFYAIFHTPREQHSEIFTKIRSFLPVGGYLLVTMGASNWVGTESNFCGVDMEWSHYDAETNKKLVADAGFELELAEVDDSGGEKHLVILGRRA